jgi:hypothetical protein
MRFAQEQKIFGFVNSSEQTLHFPASITETENGYTTRQHENILPACAVFRKGMIYWLDHLGKYIEGPAQWRFQIE